MAHIAAGICLIELRSCVRYVFSKTAKDYASIEKQKNLGSCSSQVGKIGGKQIVKLARDGKHGCFDVPGVASHELLHVAGFWHEQQRSNRDQYIVVNFKNIDKKRWSQFDFRYPPSPTYAGKVDYDYMSVMHYSDTGFAKPGKKSMTPIDKHIKKLGNRKDLSEKDILRLNAYYKCTKDHHGHWLVDGKKAGESGCKKIHGGK